MSCCNCGGYHEMSLDWIIETVKKLNDSNDENFQTALKEYMDKYFSELALNFTYDENTHTIKFTEEEGQDNGKYADKIQIMNEILKIVDSQASADIEQIKKDILQVETTVETALKCNFDLSNLVIFGDSYTQAYSPDGTVKSWAETLSEMVSPTNFAYHGEGGTGFSHTSASTGRKARAAWDAWKSSVDWIADTTTVIVMLGYNDADQTSNNVKTGMDDFFSTVHADCPKAKILYLLNPSIIPRSRNIWQTCMNQANTYSYVINAESYYWLLLETGLFSSDKVHPNNGGQSRIAKYVYQTLFGISIQHVISKNLTFRDGISGNGFLKVMNDRVEMYLFSTVTATRATAMADFDSWMFPDGSPYIKTNDIMGLEGDGTNIDNVITVAYGGDYNKVIYAIHVGDDLSTGKVHYSKTYNVIEFFAGA